MFQSLSFIIIDVYSSLVRFTFGEKEIILQIEITSEYILTTRRFIRDRATIVP